MVSVLQPSIRSVIWRGPQWCWLGRQMATCLVAILTWPGNAPEDGNCASTHPIKLDMGKRKKTGILCDPNHGATFGDAVLSFAACDMHIFRCGASTSARFCPGYAYHCLSGRAESRSSRNIDEVEVFAVRAYNRAPAPVVSGYGAFDEVAPRSMPTIILNYPEVFQSHLPSASTASIPPMPCRKGGQQTQGPHAAETQNSDSVQCSHFRMPDHARFCMDCGQRLKRSRTRSPEPRSKVHVDQLDLDIVGFKLPYEEEHTDHFGDEALWDHFRARLMDLYATTWEVKEETEETGDIVTVPIDAVYNLQQRCSSRFRDGRPLAQTIQQLKSGQVNELHHPHFVLNVAKTVLDSRAIAGLSLAQQTPLVESVVYTLSTRGVCCARDKPASYTFDQRRLLCKRQAGKQHVRVRIRLAGRKFDEFARKARERLGCHDKIRVNGSYYWANRCENPGLLHAAVCFMMAVLSNQSVSPINGFQDITTPRKLRYRMHDSFAEGSWSDGISKG